MINGRSLENKVDEFFCLVEAIQPCVVMGTESWLDDFVLNSEMFPKGFAVYRNDRNAHGGGVFLLIDSWWASSELQVPRNDTESVSCRVHLPKGGTLVLGTYYRPPTINNIDELGQILSTISDSSIIVGGDFNLPNINWVGTLILVMTVPPCINLLMTSLFHQFVLSPTRKNCILNLLMTNNPSIISNVFIISGISDHRAVVCELPFNKINRVSKPPRKVMMYGQGNHESISLELSAYSPYFYDLSKECDVKELWETFKRKIKELADSYIPSYIPSRTIRKIININHG